MKSYFELQKSPFGAKENTSHHDLLDDETQEPYLRLPRRQQQQSSSFDESESAQMKRRLIKKSALEQVETSIAIKHSAVLCGHAVGKIYHPTLKEQVKMLLRGRTGLILEMVNLVLSVIAFFLYVAEMYDNQIYDSSARKWVELSLIMYFIFDMLLHLYAADSATKYLLSTQGIVDLLTIVPALIVNFMPGSESQKFFVLRVLRIFRALRVLRLKEFITFKKNGFDYELTVFLLSSIAIILCAAGVFQALEKQAFEEKNQTMAFHQALYFILVTISTVGYGDISPSSTWSEIFVMVLLIAVFTVVPRQLAKLNELSKENHSYEKEYILRAANRSSSGHVVVSGCDLTLETVRDFLQEFYHPSRGSIQLDVVFMSDKTPSKALERFLLTEKLRHKTLFLRGNLTLEIDRQRAKLADATAVFLLAKEKQNASAAFFLQALSIRNNEDARKHLEQIDLYLQQAGEEEEEEEVNNQEETEEDEYGAQEEEDEDDLSCFLLNANIMRTTTLRHAILARAAVCPGAGTLLLNLLRSVDPIRHYAKYRPWKQKLWLEEYTDGMGYQLYPLIFSKAFDGKTFQQVAEKVYLYFHSILFALHSKQDGKIQLNPIKKEIQQGTIGFVLARNAAVVHQIVQKYGFWEEFQATGQVEKEEEERTSSFHAEKRQFPNGHNKNPSIPCVRVSSDTLIKRPAPHGIQRLHLSPIASVSSSKSFSLGSPDEIKKNSWTNQEKVHPLYEQKRSKWDEEEEDNQRHQDEEQDQKQLLKQQQQRVEFEEDEDVEEREGDYHDDDTLANNRQLEQEELLKLLKTHVQRHVKGYRDHVVLCGNSMRQVLPLLTFVRLFYEQQDQIYHRMKMKPPRSSSRPVNYVLLLKKLPSLKDLRFFYYKENKASRRQQQQQGQSLSVVEKIAFFYQGVTFVHGTAEKSKDLLRVASAFARHVVLLPIKKKRTDSLALLNERALEASSSQENEKEKSGSTVEGADNLSMDDFGVIKALLALEMNQKLPYVPKIEKTLEPLRRRASGRLLTTHEAGATNCYYNTSLSLENRRNEPGLSSYKRELRHGLPLESVQIRMMERYPDLDPTLLHEESGDDGSFDESLPFGNGSSFYHHGDGAVTTGGDSGGTGRFSDVSLGPQKCVAVLQHARNAKYCRPRDLSFCRDELPFLSPSFASGSLFLSSVLDRIICQAFYNPYIVDLVQALASGEVNLGPNDNNGAAFLTQMAIPIHLINGTFGDLFYEFITQKQLLVIALWRMPNDTLGNVLPYVYTCPASDTLLEAGDRLFVIT